MSRIDLISIETGSGQPRWLRTGPEARPRRGPRAGAHLPAGGGGLPTSHGVSGSGKTHRYRGLWLGPLCRRV